MPISKADILAANDRPITTISVPEWGGDGALLLRNLSSADAIRMSRQQAQAGEKGMSDTAMAEWIAAAAVDADGEKLFAPDEVVLLADKSQAVVMRVFQQLLELNGVTEDEQRSAEGN